jgi:hypothetical protein
VAPAARVGLPEPVDLSPAQRTQLLPTGADEQREHDVGVEPEALGPGEQRLGPGHGLPVPAQQKRGLSS